MARDSQKKWRTARPHYDREYRAQHPEYHVRNRQQQQRRDQKRYSTACKEQPGFGSKAFRG
jgi:hypothetical protein